MFRRTYLPIPLAAAVLALAACGNSHPGGSTGTTTPTSFQDAAVTTTPIKHLVVIFNENVSFDHYFGTYPKATNPTGEPAFSAATGTPSVNGLTTALQTNNPNVTNATNVALATAGSFSPTEYNPFRLDRSQANTADQNHAYTAEQLASDNGLMDEFPAQTGSGTSGDAGAFGTIAQVMGFFDGNTVTGMWNYAQNFALNDNAYTDTYGPSTPGALGVVSGTLNGAVAGIGTSAAIADGAGGMTLIGDTDPNGDTCASKTSTVSMTSKNIGDLLNAKGLTWGGFMGGFNLTTTNANGTSGCSRSTFSSVLNATEADYSPHHAWFQYYASTQNPMHTRPTSTALIGYADPLDSSSTPVHHQYDVQDFMTAVKSGNYPSVSYIKPPRVNDAHPGNSDPLDEQAFVTNLVNFLQEQPDWNNTAVIITYDDSDGWYDHQFATPTTSSFDTSSVQSVNTVPGTTAAGTVTGADQLNGTGRCTSSTATQGVGLTGSTVNGLCGPGTRVPLIVISPWARVNYVDHTSVSQASVVRFIEDNWLGSQRIGQGSKDATAGSIMSMFDFSGNQGKAPTLYLDTTLGTKLSSAPTIN
jgi:phospholipase C